MEAMWSRFLPAYVALRGILDEGRIGEPLLVEADFGWRSPVVPTDRHYDLAQGGGALLDLGVYTVQLCTLVLGTPDAVVGTGPRRHHRRRRGIGGRVALLRTAGSGSSSRRSARR